MTDIRRHADPLEALRDVAWPHALRARVQVETWTLEKPFIIARGCEDAIDLVTVTLEAGTVQGRGEACPVRHYGETTESVVALTEQMLQPLRTGRHWADCHDTCPPGAARNAVDCAVWDLVAKLSGQRVHEMLGFAAPKPVETVFTLSVDTPERMAEAAVAAGAYRHLKLKLGGEGDIARVEAVRAAAPDKVLIADVNEAWSRQQLLQALPALQGAGLRMLEQPLRAGSDADLTGIERLVPLGADESCHVSDDLDALKGLYDVINIKLDKTGGLTEAVRLLQRAEQMGFTPMVGCMLGTSLAMAPAHLIAQRSAFVDIDAPLLIGADREGGLTYEKGVVSPPGPGLWG